MTAAAQLFVTRPGDRSECSLLALVICPNLLPSELVMSPVPSEDKEHVTLPQRSPILSS